MNKTLLILIGVMLLVKSLLAQDCDETQLQKKPGTWKAGYPGSTSGVSSADLAKEKQVLAGIHKMVSANYKPLGCEITFSNSFGTQSHYTADPYYYKMYLLRYKCNLDKPEYYVEPSSPTNVIVAANVIHSLNTLYASDMRDDSRGYLKLIERPLWKNGFYYLGEEVVGDSHLENKIKEYRYLITYDQELPFIYLTQKEYLQILKAKLEKSITESPGEADYYREYLIRVNQYLTKPDTELSQAAVCMWNQDERFESFVEEGTRGSFIAIKPNPAYYKKLPRSSPQFFTIIFKISEGDPVFEGNLANIRKAIDFTTLQGMLGK
jgi:hypothetical protein